MSGNDLDVQDAIRAIGRLIGTDTVAPATRAALLIARKALQGEPPGLGVARGAPPLSPRP
jgi:hypothetical protein